MTYEEFITAKLSTVIPTGFEPADLSPWLFEFQRALVRWALRRGRAALFADTGLGKTPMLLEWAQRVREHTGKDVLILAPLAVARQIARDGAKFGIPCVYAKTMGDARPGIVVSNYDRLDHFRDVAPYLGGIVLDESSILKSFDGATRTDLIETFATTPFRLACTATPSPNDFTELGNHAEFLGIMSRVEMLSMYFVHDGGSTQDWRLMGHAEADFWRWVCSWGALVKRPSSLGYSDDGYDLPPLHIHEHVIAASAEHARETFRAAEVGAQGMLFPEAAKGLSERRAARRGSISDRVALCAEIVAKEPGEAWLIWGDLNDETDALEETIPGAVQIAGADKSDEKEARLVAFCEGRIRKLVSKVKIAGFGINAQGSARQIFCGIPKDGSFEEWYQAIRRQYRFGQKREVHVHLVVHETQAGVVKDLRRKEADALRMAEEMGRWTSAYVRESVRGAEQESTEYAPTVDMTIPEWLQGRVKIRKVA